MEGAAAALIRSPVAPYKPSLFLGRPSILAVNRPGFVHFGSYSQFSCKLHTSVSIPNKSHKREALGSRRGLVVRASSSSSPESSGSSAKIAPLELESPIGQFLSEILVSHPHLVPAAVEQQLQQLQTDRDADRHKEEPPALGTDLVLYRRIAEVKANERRKALEEILYALVVKKFMDANVSLIPCITPDPSGRVDSWPSDEGKLEQLHSSEAYEMIQNHLALIMGNRVGDATSEAQISKLRVGQVYAASVMYGYFLRRVDQRFQLEKAMKILPSAVEEENGVQQSLMEKTGPRDGENSSQTLSRPEVSALPGGGISPGVKQSRLRTYVMSFDGETLQRYATLRSKEALGIIEKHAEALFGRPEIVITPEGSVDSSKDDNIKISFGGLKRLILEAVTFGSFLWDVEGFVDSRYHFVLN